MPSRDTLRIGAIYCSGNHVTKPEAIRFVMRIREGDAYDSAFIQKVVKQRIVSTNLFSKVTILPLVKNRVVYLYVMVDEPFYLDPTGTGYSIANFRYGQPGYWFIGQASLEIKNFRGQMENLRLSAKISGLNYPYPPEYWTLRIFKKEFDFLDFTKFSLRWLEWRGLGVSWSKPIFPSQYTLGIGAGFDSHPDELNPYIHTETSTRLSIGRKFFERSNGSISIIPDFRKNIALESHGKDTTIFELFSAIGWSLDRRQRFFDPIKGWSLNLDIRTNYLFHGNDSGFAQFTQDLKYYQPLFLENHRLAFHLRAIFRTQNAGEFNRVLTGGESSVRGYFTNQIGLTKNWVGNDALSGSGEYRFPIHYFHTVLMPEFTRSAFSAITGEDQYLSWRLDGAFFADYGRIASTFSSLMNPKGNPRQSGLSIGCGLRLLEHKKNIRVTVDVAIPENIFTEKTDLLGSGASIQYIWYIANYF